VGVAVEATFTVGLRDVKRLKHERERSLRLHTLASVNVRGGPLRLRDSGGQYDGMRRGFVFLLGGGLAACIDRLGQAVGAPSELLPPST